MLARQANDTRPLAQPGERRRHQRVPVALLGRYMLVDRQEYPCQTIDMSPGGVLLLAPVRGAVGTRCVVYLEHIGRVEGEIVRHVPQGFALCATATARKRDRIASQLTWLANRQELGLPEDRRHERITPRQALTTLKLESGRSLDVRIIDVSMSGAAVSTDQALAIGLSVTLGSTGGRIVRHFAGGVAVEFRLPLSPDRFDETIVL